MVSAAPSNSFPTSSHRWSNWCRMVFAFYNTSHLEFKKCLVCRCVPAWLGAHSSLKGLHVSRVFARSAQPAKTMWVRRQHPPLQVLLKHKNDHAGWADCCRGCSCVPPRGWIQAVLDVLCPFLLEPRAPDEQVYPTLPSNLMYFKFL